MGIHQDSITQSDVYRQRLYKIGDMLFQRLMRPWIRNDIIYKLFGYQKQLNKYLIPVHEYTTKIINNRRQVFLQQQLNVEPDSVSENM